MGLVETFEGVDTQSRVEIYLRSDNVYEAHYFSLAGGQPIVERYDGKSYHYVERAATNWLSGVKVLNG